MPPAHCALALEPPQPPPPLNYSHKNKRKNYHSHGQRPLPTQLHCFTSKLHTQPHTLNRIYTSTAIHTSTSANRFYTFTAPPPLLVPPPPPPAPPPPFCSPSLPSAGAWLGARLGVFSVRAVFPPPPPPPLSLSLSSLSSALPRLPSSLHICMAYLHGIIFCSKRCDGLELEPEILLKRIDVAPSSPSSLPCGLGGPRDGLVSAREGCFHRNHGFIIRPRALWRCPAPKS